MADPVVSTQAEEVEDPIGKTLQKLLKPGAKTTEFAGLVAMWAGVLATLFGAFNTSSPKFNAILKVAALVAAAASQVGYALSRGDTKAALAGFVGALADSGVVRYTPKHAPNPDDSGVIGITELISAVFVVAGLIWLIVGFAHHRLDVFGLVLAAIGVIIGILFGGRSLPLRRPRQ